MEQKEKEVKDMAYQEVLERSEVLQQAELSIQTKEEITSPNFERSAPPIEIIVCATAMFALTHKTPYAGIGAFFAQGFFLYTLYSWSKRHSRPLSTDAWIAGGFALLFAFSDVITLSLIHI